MKKRTPLGYSPPDPRYKTNFMDSCAFDPKYSPENGASLRIFSLYEEETIVLIVAHSTIKEIEHPNTPAWVKNEAGAMIYTISTGLTEQEVTEQETILRILTGNGKSEKMKKDADHIFEASKYCGYFITTDKRILKKKDDLHAHCAAIIVKPSEFLEIYEACAPTPS